MKNKELIRNCLVLISLGYALLYSIYEQLNIISASRQGWIIETNYNSIGEGLLEMYFIFPLIIIIILIAFILHIQWMKKK